MSSNIFNKIRDVDYLGEPARNISTNLIKNNLIKKNHCDLWKYVYGEKYEQEWDVDFSINNGDVNHKKIEELLLQNNDRNNLMELFKECKQKSKQYDLIYSIIGDKNLYTKHYSETIYFNLWEKVIKILKEKKLTKIIDIGCGVGQFANALFDNGFTDYLGIDFSKSAIRSAKILNKKNCDKFYVQDISRTDIFESGYDVAILLEVLEHVEKDLDIMMKIPKGKLVLFSVPNFDCAQHVRYFNSLSEVLKRYGKYIHVTYAEEFELNCENTKIYLVMGTRV